MSTEATKVDLTTKLLGTCKGGEVNLSLYPNLTHAPAQWGEGVRTHLAGKCIKEIAERSMMKWDSEPIPFVELADWIAKDCGVTFDELLDALRYARANKLI